MSDALPDTSGEPVPNAALDIRNLTISYAGEQGRIVPVADLSMQISAGEVRGLVGESGSGKSTVAKAVTGLLGRWGRVESGTVLLSGHEITALSENARAGLFRDRAASIVFQDPLNALDPVRTVYSQVAEALRLRGARLGRRRGATRAAVAELLNSVQIRDPLSVMRRYPHELSGGMRQRVVIGMAVVGPPSLLIADEATTALDVATQRALVDLLRQLVDNAGSALLFITHNLALASEICDTVSVMYGGQIVESGRCADVVSDPCHPYTQGLINAIPRLRGPLQPVVGIPGVPYAGGGVWKGCAFLDRCYLTRGRAECEEITPLLHPPSIEPGDTLVRCHFEDEARLRWRSERP